jgi:hypothetical protein
VRYRSLSRWQADPDRRATAHLAGVVGPVITPRGVQPDLAEHTASMLASSATDIATAVGTALAAAIALATLVFLCYQWAKDRRERRNDKERKQAVLVNFWVEETSTEIPASYGDPLSITGKLQWLNRSDDPAYSVSILGLLATQEIGGFPITETRHTLSSPDRITMPVLAPGSKGDRQCTWKFDELPDVLMHMEFVLVWQFKDSAGVTWQKNSRGSLERIKISPKLRNEIGAIIIPIMEDAAKEMRELADRARVIADGAKTMDAEKEMGEITDKAIKIANEAMKIAERKRAELQDKSDDQQD